MPKKSSTSNRFLDPDEIFLDAKNLSALDAQQFEGHLEQPISRTTLGVAAIAFLLIGVAFLARIGFLQVAQGANFAARSTENSLRYTPIVPDRGVIYDRTGAELAWNKPERTYITDPGFGPVLGYLGYPTSTPADDPRAVASELVGKDGVEAAFDTTIAGSKGLRIEEVDAQGNVISDHQVEAPTAGQSITLSVDARLQAELYKIISGVASDRGFSGGAGMVMDVHSGELLALDSYPDYDPNVMTSHTDPGLVQSYLTDPALPFLNRAISGLYTPGSIFKTIMAAGVLQEGVISPTKQILSTGQIEIPNPYDPTQKTVFKDWQPQGWVDIRHALSMSSDVYFYEVGGGFQGQPGLGINKINHYANLFGLASTTGIQLPGEKRGTIPSQDWKALNFPTDPTWRVGDTYHTSIGQYGVIVTPIEMVRVAAALANGGTLITPTVLKTATSTELAAPVGPHIPVSPENFQIIREGMHLSATVGVGKGLNTPSVDVAAKTGTAELGVSKANVNSWVIGFWPYDHPRYAFAVVMEHGGRTNTIGGVFVMRTFLDWMAQNTPEYLK